MASATTADSAAEADPVPDPEAPPEITFNRASVSGSIGAEEPAPDVNPGIPEPPGIKEPEAEIVDEPTTPEAPDTPLVSPDPEIPKPPALPKAPEVREADDAPGCYKPLFRRFSNPDAEEDPVVIPDPVAAPVPAPAPAPVCLKVPEAAS